MIPNVDDLVKQATVDTGLDDFGDPTFRDGLDVFIANVDGEARLNQVGLLVAKGQIESALRTRLLVEQWYNQHPGVSEERITSPIFIVGMSRSGTTALSHLLARDPANRSLLGWEARAPVPPPTAGCYSTDPRFESARANEFGLLHQLNAQITAMHHDPPDMPVECLILMTQHFVTLSLAAMFPAPKYARWVLDEDHTSVYQWHERVLSLLQSGGVRGRWQLKSPQHAIALDALVERYPDARFIVTHRDPATCVASAASLARAFAGTFAEPRPGNEFGPLWSDILAAMGDGISDFRRRHGDDRFVDVSYRDLTSQPMETVRHIYDGLGEHLSIEAEQAMCAHAEVAVPQRFGKHVYSWDDLGLNRADLDERFSSYRARFADHLR
jgi:hypothetical protein